MYMCANVQYGIQYGRFRKLGALDRCEGLEHRSPAGELGVPKLYYAASSTFLLDGRDRPLFGEE